MVEILEAKMKSATYWTNRIADIEQILTTCKPRRQKAFKIALEHATKKLAGLRGKCGFMANAGNGVRK